ncbi:MAG: hypothetical protein RLZZ09_3352, partial [Pseudomonadota bacterium]
MDGQSELMQESMCCCRKDCGNQPPTGSRGYLISRASAGPSRLAPT